MWVNVSVLSAINSAIMARTGAVTGYAPSEMPSAILGIQTAATIGSKVITLNGTYRASDDGFDCYSVITVNVPVESSSGSSSSSSSSVMPSVVIPDWGYSIYDTSTSWIRTYSEDSSLFAATFTVAEHIYSSAFARCYNLTTFVAPELDVIAARAFERASALAYVSLPACRFVSMWAFAYTALSEVTLPACINIECSAFNGCTSLTMVSLPACASISSMAFASCTNLMSVYLMGSSVPNASQWMFKSTPLESSVNGVYGSIYVPASMIDRYLYANYWSDLAPRFVPVGGSSTSHTEPYSIYDTSTTTVGATAHANDPYLTAVTYTNARTISMYAFNGCASLSTVVAPSCTSIGQGAFDDCPAIESISLPECSDIGRYNFRSCLVSSISLPKCMEIHGSVFDDCPNIKAVNLPECVTCYGFDRCSSITSISLPKCDVVGGFDGTNITGLTLPSATGVQGFNSCSRLATINLPLCETVGGFEYCSLITSINLPECDCVYDGAFTQTGVSVARIPKCRFIQGYAFANCPSLTIYLNAVSSVTEIDSHTFWGTDLRSVYVPRSLYSDFAVAQNWSNFAQYLVSA